MGDNVPEDKVKLERVAMAEGALVTVTVYVFVVLPSWAVTTTVMVFDPTLSEIAPEAEPDVTEVPLTVMVALACVRVGVIVIDVTELATDAV